jgi:hypothetical protein
MDLIPIEETAKRLGFRLDMATRVSVRPAISGD